MGLKQKLIGTMVSQFRRPHGLGGRAAGWVMATRGSNRKRSLWAVGLLDVQPGHRVLELGFGPGVAIDELARRASNGFVVGIDHSEVMLRQARRRNAKAVRAGRVDLRLGTAERLPAFDAPFDRILAVNSLMFWDEPLERLKELRTVLSPGGRIAIAYQPRGPGSTDDAAARAGEELAGRFSAAGFADVRVQTLELRPANAVCALGTRSCSSPGSARSSAKLGPECSPSASPPAGLGHRSGGREPVTKAGDVDQARSKRSRFMTLSHAATKSRTNFSFASSPA